MKRKFLKTVAFGLVSTMAATTLLAGCGGSDSKEASGDGKKDEKVTLTFPVWDSAQNLYLEDIIKGFEKRTRTLKLIW